MSSMYLNFILFFCVFGKAVLGSEELPADHQIAPPGCNYQGLAVDETPVTFPTTSFNCWGRYDGYYADTEVDCTIFHYCQTWYFPTGHNETVKWDFVCPQTTIFNQQLLSCTPPSASFDCQESPQYYWINYNLTSNNPSTAEVPQVELVTPTQQDVTGGPDVPSAGSPEAQATDENGFHGNPPAAGSYPPYPPAVQYPPWGYPNPYVPYPIDTITTNVEPQSPLEFPTETGSSSENIQPPPYPYDNNYVQFPGQHPSSLSDADTTNQYFNAQQNVNNNFGTPAEEYQFEGAAVPIGSGSSNHNDELSGGKPGDLGMNHDDVAPEEQQPDVSSSINSLEHGTSDLGGSNFDPSVQNTNDFIDEIGNREPISPVVPADLYPSEPNTGNEYEEPSVQPVHSEVSYTELVSENHVDGIVGNNAPAPPNPYSPESVGSDPTPLGNTEDSSRPIEPHQVVSSVPQAQDEVDNSSADPVTFDNTEYQSPWAGNTYNKPEPDNLTEPQNPTENSHPEVYVPDAIVVTVPANEYSELAAQNSTDHDVQHLPQLPTENEKPDSSYPDESTFDSGPTSDASGEVFPDNKEPIPQFSIENQPEVINSNNDLEPVSPDNNIQLPESNSAEVEVTVTPASHNLNENSNSEPDELLQTGLTFPDTSSDVVSSHENTNDSVTSPLSESGSEENIGVVQEPNPSNSAQPEQTDVDSSFGNSQSLEPSIPLDVQSNFETVPVNPTSDSTVPDPKPQVASGDLQHEVHSPPSESHEDSSLQINSDNSANEPEIVEFTVDKEPVQTPTHTADSTESDGAVPDLGIAATENPDLSNEAGTGQNFIDSQTGDYLTPTESSADNENPEAVGLDENINSTGQDTTNSNPVRENEEPNVTFVPPAEHHQVLDDNDSSSSYPTSDTEASSTDSGTSGDSGSDVADPELSNTDNELSTLTNESQLTHGNNICGNVVDSTGGNTSNCTANSTASGSLSEESEPVATGETNTGSDELVSSTGNLSEPSQVNVTSLTETSSNDGTSVTESDIIPEDTETNLSSQGNSNEQRPSSADAATQTTEENETQTEDDVAYPTHDSHSTVEVAPGQLNTFTSAEEQIVVNASVNSTVNTLTNTTVESPHKPSLLGDVDKGPETPPETNPGSNPGQVELVTETQTNDSPDILTPNENIHNIDVEHEKTFPNQTDASDKPEPVSESDLGSDPALPTFLVPEPVGHVLSENNEESDADSTSVLNNIDNPERDVAASSGIDNSELDPTFIVPLNENLEPEPTFIIDFNKNIDTGNSDYAVEYFTSPRPYPINFSIDNSRSVK
ncbi:hypothetical protein RUM44_003551 [Polyplax serrata]|uniref:Chitin-binding type-2 domain-containing protein n=1 Tax=Polyplax serrata TaxID=468196 RepID=A0ABR1AGS6_POLSC